MQVFGITDIYTTNINMYEIQSENKIKAGFLLKSVVKIPSKFINILYNNMFYLKSWDRVDCVKGSLNG